MAKVKEDSDGSKRKTRVTRESHQNYKLISLQKPCRPEISGKIYSKF